MKYEKGKWYNFTIKSECECAMESIAKWLEEGYTMGEILRGMRGQMKANDPYWLPEEWFGNTTILCVTETDTFEDMLRISPFEKEGYYVPITFIKEATLINISTQPTA